MSEQELKALRLRIDALDEKVLELISERARCAQEVARVKMASLAEGEVPVFYRPEREAQVLKRVMERNQGPLGNEEMARLFREIMSSCLALEQPLKVAYLGPEGTFTQAAAMKHFGHAVISKPMAAIDEVFREVAAGAVNFGVVPVENSTEGAVNHTLDSFLEHDMVICVKSSCGFTTTCWSVKTPRPTASAASTPMPSRWPSAASGWMPITRMSSAWRCPATPKRPSGSRVSGTRRRLPATWPQACTG